MKPQKTSLLAAVVLFWGLWISIPLRAAQSLNDFVVEVKKTLENKDIPGYIKVLSPPLRTQERIAISSYFEDLGFKTISVYTTSRQNLSEDRARLYLLVLYQNTFSAYLETWRLDLLKRDEGWLIDNKVITGNVRNLYKIHLPADRIERVKSIEIDNVDLRMSFKDALVFYDNIPGIETALLVIGEGTLSFHPSLERERHQLDLVYGKKSLEDELKYAYMRFSNSFFHENIKIVKDERQKKPVSKNDLNEAYALFTRHYSRSFTIENSLTGELFSSLPQGDESVFEFETKKSGIFTYIYSPYAEEEINLFEWEKDRMLNLYSPALDSEGKKLFIVYDNRFDVTNYEIDIDFNPEKKYLSGRARIRVESTIGNLGRINFKLNPDLEILRVNDQESHSLFYTQDKLRNNVYIYFLNPVMRNESQIVEVYYRGVLNPPDVLSDVLTLGGQTAVPFLDPPKMDTFLYSRSAYWYPAPEEDDYFTSRLKIIVPPKYTVVSNGLLLEQSTMSGLNDVEDVERVGKEVYEFQTASPVKYLTFIVGDFKNIKEENRTIPIRYLRTREAPVPFYDIVEEAGAILDFYQKTFGPYPFNKLTIAHRLWKQSGGHSPPSFIVLNELPNYAGVNLRLDKDSPVNLSNYREYFLSHEMAHQWWGQGVGWETYQDQWISEGMAQFASILYLKLKHGDKAFSKIIKRFSDWTRKKSKWGRITMGSRISYFDFKGYQSIVYDKTSLVLNMLRVMLGEDVFFQGMKKFFMEKKFSAARTQDFFKTMKDVSGKDLDSFFTPWFYSYKLPEAKVTHAVKPKEGGGYTLGVNVMQTGETFVFPLMIQWVEEGKKVSRIVLVDKNNQEFLFQLTNKPRKIKINPDDMVPGRFF